MYLIYCGTALHKPPHARRGGGVAVNILCTICSPCFIPGHLRRITLLNDDGLCFLFKWAALWQNQQFGLCAQRRLRSAWVSSEDSDQPGHPHRLNWFFAVRSVDSWGPKLSSCGQQRLWSDWADKLYFDEWDPLVWVRNSNLTLFNCLFFSFFIIIILYMPFCWFSHEAAQVFQIALQIQARVQWKRRESMAVHSNKMRNERLVLSDRKFFLRHAFCSRLHFLSIILEWKLMISAFLCNYAAIFISSRARKYLKKSVAMTGYSLPLFRWKQCVCVCVCFFIYSQLNKNRKLRHLKLAGGYD